MKIKSPDVGITLSLMNMKLPYEDEMHDIGMAVCLMKFTDVGKTVSRMKMELPDIGKHLVTESLMKMKLPYLG